MDRSTIEMLSASLVREYLSKKRLVKTLQQLDEEQSGYSKCVRNRLKLMKALHIGRLMKRNKELDSALDSMVEVIVHFLLRHARTSRSHTQAPQNDHVCEREEDQLVKASSVDNANLLEVYSNPLPTNVDTNEILFTTNEVVAQYGNDKESGNDVNEQCQYFSQVCDNNEQYNTKREQCTPLKPQAKITTDICQSKYELREYLACKDYNGKTNDIKCSLPVANILTNIESCESSSGESDTDSKSESSVSSVVDLKDMPDGGGNPFGVTTDMIFRVPHLSQVQTPQVSGSQQEVNVIVAWSEKSDNEGTETCTTHALRHKKCEHSGEVTEATEKWASERPEKHEKAIINSLKEARECHREFPPQEEVGSAAPSRLGVGTLSRPSTQESTLASQHLLWLQENSRDGGVTGGILHHGREGSGSSGESDKRSPDLLQLNTRGSNLSSRHVLPNPLDTYRANTQGRSVFDSEADVDIASVAAQRDQLRGARNIRGMMAPVTSKEEESHSRSAIRRMALTKQHSESILGDHDSEDTRVPSTESRENDHNSDVLGNLIVKRSGSDISSQVRALQAGLVGIGLRPHVDYLDAARFGDIMAQSMRRQSLRGSKQSLLDGNYASLESNTSSRISMGEATPEGDRYPIDEQGYIKAKRKNLQKLMPSSREDIQILNLQGFMDASGAAGDGGSSSKRKHKKRRNKRAIDSGHQDKGSETYKLNTKSRRKRSHRLSKTHLSDDDDDGEMMLKDIDDIDNKVAGLVLGPENICKESSGRPITLDEASKLRSILTGSPAQPLPTEWLSQNFKQNSNPNLSYGLIQKKGGPCGVLACVQAYIMKCLIFGTTVAPNTSPISPLRPSQREWLWALGVAVTEILWKAGQEQKAVLAMPGSFAHFTEHGIGRYSQDGMTENLTLHEFLEQRDMYDAVTRHISAFTSENSSGCVILLYSLIFTRGIENIQGDMDSGGGHLINAHGYSSQEIVNLLLTGKAFTNTFDGDQILGNTASESVVLHGITHKAEIGLFSLFEHYDCFKVGNFLKSPQYPIWVVCCESHYSCLFSRDTSVASDTPSASKFDIYYYDGLALQEDEIRLSIDLDGDENDLTIVPPLEHCIRTKWKNASVNWNGTDPIL